MSLTPWEYKTQLANSVLDLAKMLPELGQSGWDLVSVVTVKPGSAEVLAIFKRPQMGQ